MPPTMAPTLRRVVLGCAWGMIALLLLFSVLVLTVGDGHGTGHYYRAIMAAWMGDTSALQRECSTEALRVDMGAREELARKTATGVWDAPSAHAQEGPPQPPTIPTLPTLLPPTTAASPMTVIVTGAAGFIGFHTSMLCRQRKAGALHLHAQPSTQQQPHTPQVCSSMRLAMPLLASTRSTHTTMSASSELEQEYWLSIAFRT